MKYLISVFFFFGLLLQTDAQDLLLLKTNGKVVIGDTSVISTPGAYNLYVQNGVLTERVKVALENTNQWSDHAFNQTPTLEMVKKSIKEHSHLYDMPSAATIVSEGYELQSMDAKILAQVEWLWQHTIELAEQNKKMRQEIEDLQKKLAAQNNK